MSLFPEAKVHASLDAQIACVKREVAMRRRAYPRWVQQGRMKQAVADHEIALMEEVQATLQGLAEERRRG